MDVKLKKEVNHQISIQLKCWKDADQAVQHLMLIAGEGKTNWLASLLMEEMLAEGQDSVGVLTEKEEEVPFQGPSIKVLEHLNTSAPGMYKVLWPKLLSFVVAEEYTPALTPLCRCLKELATLRLEGSMLFLGSCRGGGWLSFLYKALGVALACCEDWAFVQRRLEELVEKTDFLEAAQIEKVAKILSFSAAGHLGLTLATLEDCVAGMELKMRLPALLAHQKYDQNSR
ncbi:uncharacterized protein LOC140702552 [Pogona vitticeps]